VAYGWNGTFELLKAGSDFILVDYASGLMWHFSTKKMNYNQAQWWTSLRYAEFNNWRLPTAEEALTLQRYSGQIEGTSIDGALEVWTADEGAKGIPLILKLSGQFRLGNDSSEEVYLFAVRSIL
jgi:hypothetical protein